MYLFQNAALQQGHLKKKNKKQELLKKITL